MEKSDDVRVSRPTATHDDLWETAILTVARRIHLSATLYTEHLVDRDHYLDWVLSSLEGSDLDTLPIWFLVLQTVREDLVEYRRYGRRLAGIVLDKLQVVRPMLPLPILARSRIVQAVNTGDRNMYGPIICRLSKMVEELLRTNSACFVIPHGWASYEATLQSCIDPKDSSLIARYERLAQRNRHLTDVGRSCKDELGQSPRERLTRRLDSLRAPYDVPAVSDMCLSAFQSHDAAIDILLQWVSTPYRDEEARVYLTARLLRKWNRAGCDTDKAILSFLSGRGGSTGLRAQKLFQVIVELIRSRQFSVGRYCQWLLARGVLNDSDRLSEVRNIHTYGQAAFILTHLRRATVTFTCWAKSHSTPFRSPLSTSDRCFCIRRLSLSTMRAA